VFNSGVADNEGSEYFSSINSYSSAEWSKMETNGAVFLPAAGYRDGTSVTLVGILGRYWSASAYDAFDASGISFMSNIVRVSRHSRPNGISVRLVQDVE
ncbi:MAG: hypothetical protein J6X43_03420, partial [Bacteroidales bacterium]|nr:hypothetical protein [Bacteroidales bacterium]